MKTRAECLCEYGSDYMLKKKIESGELYKLGKSVYSEDVNVPEIAVLSYLYPKAVVTMHNAFYIYGLTGFIPESYDFATDRNAAKIKDERVTQYFISSDFFDRGIEKKDYKGYTIKIYSKERMLIELLRYKSKLPFDYYKEVLLNYRKLISKLDIKEIQDLAVKSPKSTKIIDLLKTEVL